MMAIGRCHGGMRASGIVIGIIGGLPMAWARRDLDCSTSGQRLFPILHTSTSFVPTHPGLIVRTICPRGLPHCDLLSLSSAGSS